MLRNILIQRITATLFPHQIPLQTRQMLSPFVMHRFLMNPYPFQACTHSLLYNPIPFTTLRSPSKGVQLRQTNTPGSGVGFPNARKFIWNFPTFRTPRR